MRVARVVLGTNVSHDGTLGATRDGKDFCTWCEKYHGRVCHDLQRFRRQIDRAYARLFPDRGKVHRRYPVPESKRALR